MTQCAVYTCHYYAGSIPERDGDKLYNTCTVFNPDGELIAKYRKVCHHHIFKITRITHCYSITEKDCELHVHVLFSYSQYCVEDMNRKLTLFFLFIRCICLISMYLERYVSRSPRHYLLVQDLLSLKQVNVL